MNRNPVQLPPVESELARLVELMCDGAISPAERDRLESLMENNRDAKLFYIAYLDLHAQMQWMMRDEKEVESGEQSAVSGQQSETENFPSPACGREVGGESDWRRSTNSNVNPPIPISIILDTSSPLSPLPSPLYIAHPFLFSNLFAILVIGVGVLGAWLYQIDIPQPVAQNDRPSRSSGKLPESEKMEFVGHVSGMVDVKWADINTSTEHGNGVPLGRKYALLSGLMEITYDTGAKVILQGPVTYKVDSRAGGFLSIGKLTARLEKNGAGGRGPGPETANQKSALSPLPSSLFTIKTPTATVTDLGTEFGVEVDKQGRTDTQVFVGAVRIASLNEQGDDIGQSQTIRAGQYAHVATNRAISAGERDFQKLATRFKRTMPKPRSEAQSYGDLVLSMNPVVYYRMDQWPASGEKNRYVLVDSAPGGHHGVAYIDESYGKPSNQGKFGAAMDIHSQSAKEYASVKDYPKTENDQLSVSIWVKSLVVDPWAVIVGGGLLNFSAESQIIERMGGQFSIGVNDARELYVLVRQQDDGEGVQVVERGNPLPQNKWHHVALVADGEILHLYRNGREIGAAPYRGIVRQPVRKCLNLGCCQVKRDGGNSRIENAYFWNGWLDEIAVFNHTLSTEQVRQLYSGQAAAAKGRTSP